MPQALTPTKAKETPTPEKLGFLTPEKNDSGVVDDPSKSPNKDIVKTESPPEEKKGKGRKSRKNKKARKTRKVKKHGTRKH